MSNNKIQTLSAEDNLEQLKQWAESYPEKQNLLTAGTGISIDNNTISCTLDTTVFKIVESLPTSDINTNVIYVVPSDEPGEQNMYTEYIYVDGSWEKFGEFKANVDLSDYYTKEETYSSTEINELIKSATAGGITSINVSGSSPLTLDASVSETTATITGSVDLSDYYTKSDADSLLDEKANAGDVYTKNETYTQTEVNSMVSNLESHEVDVYSISGEAPLTLVGTYTEADRTLTITGSVDTYDKDTIDDMISTAVAGGITSITASGTSPLTLNASISGTSATITGSVDLSSKQDVLSAGENISISGSTISATDTTYSAGTNVQISSSNVISATDTTYSNATSSSAGLMSSSDKTNLDSLNSNAITSVSASGTNPLTLSASQTGNSLSISGSVDLSSCATTSDIEDLRQLIQDNADNIALIVELLTTIVGG